MKKLLEFVFIFAVLFAVIGTGLARDETPSNNCSALDGKLWCVTEWHRATAEEKALYCDRRWEEALKPFKEVGRPPTNLMALDPICSDTRPRR